MGLRDLLKKKQHLDEDIEGPDPATIQRLNAPEFKFVRSDTYTEEVIHPPGGPRGESNDDSTSYLTAESNRGEKSSRLSLDVFRSSNRSRSGSVSSGKSANGGSGSGSKRLSHRLHLSRSPVSSENVPKDLPEIVVPEGAEEDKDGTTESQWEKRATMLAMENEKNRSRPGTPVGGSSIVSPTPPRLTLDGSIDPHQPPPPNPSEKVVSSKAIDDDIQEAIRLHESGQLEKSTALFGRLADPNGANNPLSQVLYGLALRYVPLSCVIVAHASVLFVFTTP